MPTYSYRCTECDTAFDIQQAFTDDSLTVCPTCSGKLRKVFSAIGVSFTGSGFYRNDSRAEASAKKSTSTDSASKSSTDSGSGEKVAAKSADATSSASKSSENKSTPAPASSGSTSSSTPS